jgi:hypothetical protein
MPTHHPVGALQSPTAKLPTQTCVNHHHHHRFTHIGCATRSAAVVLGLGQHMGQTKVSDLEAGQAEATDTWQSCPPQHHHAQSKHSCVRA